MFSMTVRICDRLEERFFRKYGLNVKLNREASWATSWDYFGRLDASPVVSGAVTNARIGAEGARHAPLCCDDNSPQRQ